MTPWPNADALLEHRRELHKSEDGRIAAVETQASAVIAATIAVLAFFFASDDYALGECGSARGKPCLSGGSLNQSERWTRVMIVLGADAHKRSHTIVAVLAATGELLGEQRVLTGAKGAGALLTWARGLGSERV